jgi:hypothetical protein
MATRRVDLLVRDLAAELALEARGEVCELGWSAPRRYGPAVAHVRHLTRPGDAAAMAPVDTVLAVCELWRERWGADELAALAGRLRPGGRLLFVEPVAVTGASGVVQRLVDALVPGRWRRLRYRRAITDELRAAGLTPVRIDRISADRAGRVRCFVVGEAVPCLASRPAATAIPTAGPATP